MKRKNARRCSLALSLIFLACTISASGFTTLAAEQQNTEAQEFRIDENGGCPELEEEVVSLLNAELTKKWVKGEDGKKKKRKPLKVKSVLQRAARARAKEMFNNEYLGSWRPNGDTWQTIFDEKKYLLKNIKIPGEVPIFRFITHMITAEEVVEAFKGTSSVIDDDLNYIGVGFHGETEDGCYLVFVDVILVQL
ncbi:hypothetical protein FACS1894198_6190 [Clostridia bacterium]|nr:hypothetical protein FACS1894198_6190 [Clostridia bacterium]